MTYRSWNSVALVTVAVMLLAHSIAPAADDGKAVVLFNGKDLSGWTAVLEEPRDKNAAKPKAEDVWTVKEGGVLYCKGNPRGYIRTDKDDFENYTLELEWRFPEASKGGNSGVLVHTGPPGAIGIWPQSMEAQLNHQNAGDIWVIGTTCKIENAAERVMGRRHLNLTDDSEKPIGQWNQYKIVCDGDTITIFVNGERVNHVTESSVTKGAISLQSEGAEIEFRNIRLTPLAK